MADTSPHAYDDRMADALPALRAPKRDTKGRFTGASPHVDHKRQELKRALQDARQRDIERLTEGRLWSAHDSRERDRRAREIDAAVREGLRRCFTMSSRKNVMDVVKLYSDSGLVFPLFGKEVIEAWREARP